MPGSVARACARLAVVSVLAASCGGEAEKPTLPAPRPPQVSGTLSVHGLSAPVTIVRDRSGVPHITASSTDDLFFAQGFVQAQDRLFQMDLWRRSAQGRLAEVLGANFLERDAMTRRIQYRGDVRADWVSYSDDAEQIATAFVRGINAVVTNARVNPPEEFRLAGWLPDEWRPEDLLNRTDAFLASAGAEDEVLRARMIASLGAARVDALWPLPGGQATRVDPALDLSVIGPVVGDMLRRVGTRPFFLGLGAAITLPAREGAPADATTPVVPLALAPGGGLAWALHSQRTSTSAPLVVTAPHRTFDAPPFRYLVHLTGPGWNVIGATSPWLPGVVIGHNDAIAWAMTPLPVDVQDLSIERLHPEDPHRVERSGDWVAMNVEMETVPIKGRAEPFEFERQSTDRGVIVGVDRERRLAYALRWPGSEPGAANELAALAIGRVQAVAGVPEVLRRWKLPVAEFVVADRQSHVGQRTAGLRPERRGHSGAVPAAGWTGPNPWSGWVDRDERAPRQIPTVAVPVAAGGDVAMAARLAQVSSATPQSLDTTKALLQDTRSLNADRLVPLLEPLSIADAGVDALRKRLLAWRRLRSTDSHDALLYARWERALSRLVVERRMPREFVSDFVRRLPVSAIVSPARAWFDVPVERDRNALLIQALAEVGTAGADAAATWGDTHRITFVHPLAISNEARRVFNVGPFAIGGGEDTLARTSADATAGAPFRAIFDVGDWDRSVAINAPGQSGSPASPHYDDLAKRWAAGEYIALPFSPAAVSEATESTLTLVPVR